MIRIGEGWEGGMREGLGLEQRVSYLPSVFPVLLGHVAHLVPKVLDPVRNYQLARVRRLESKGSFRLRGGIHKSKTIFLGRRMPMVDRSHTTDQLMSGLV